jgi:hypothetical protein
MSFSIDGRNIGRDRYTMGSSKMTLPLHVLLNMGILFAA